MTQNRIDQLFIQQPENVLSIYFTAGFPQLESTIPIIESLSKSGADIIEIGMPYSDPVADGPTIQESNQAALDGGMSLAKLFEQLQGVREKSQLPIILMGYINPVLQFGLEKFCKACAEVGVDGLILPDLPMHEYLQEYKTLFEDHGLRNVFLITPQTSEARIQEIDENSKGFIYMVSSASTTGVKSGISDEQIAYFERIKAMNLQNPRLIGFGISDNASFSRACAYANGAIIGSAFINLLRKSENIDQDIQNFVKSVKGN